jgi:hypothetical protein
MTKSFRKTKNKTVRIKKKLIKGGDLITTTINTTDQEDYIDPEDYIIREDIIEFKKYKPTYVGILTLASYKKFNEQTQSDIHLGWFYSLAAITNSESLQELFDDYGVPKSIFKGIAAKALYKTLVFYHTNITFI